MLDKNPEFARDLFEQIDNKGPVFVLAPSLVAFWPNIDGVKEWADYWGFTMEVQPMKGGVIFGLRFRSFAETLFSKEPKITESDHLERLRANSVSTGYFNNSALASSIEWAVRTIEELRARVDDMLRCVGHNAAMVDDPVAVIKMTYATLVAEREKSTELQARVAELESKLAQSKKLYELTLANELRWMRKHEEQVEALAGERKARGEAELKLDQRLVCANDHCIHTGTVHDRCETRGETSQAEEIQWLREAVWMLYQIHGGKYTEPTYTEALEKARRALEPKP